MSVELSWLLLAVPLVFALGWMASRFDFWQWKREQRESPKAYFKGLSLLLNEQQDKAIDAFIEAVQHDPDTAELHFALGSLFRRRGEYERAVRVHQHLIARADLKHEDRERAQQALAQDYLRAGIFDRAEEAWSKLQGGRFDGEARLALMSLHERARDWQAALSAAQELHRRGDGSLNARMAHYRCELALQADARGDSAAAEAELEQAQHLAPESARPWALRAEKSAREGHHAEALRALDALRAAQPQGFSRMAGLYANSAMAAGMAEPARQVLAQAYEAAPSMALLSARLKMDQATPDATVHALIAHAQHAPTLSAAQALLGQPATSWGEAGLSVVRQAVDRAAGPVQRYRCAACGFEGLHWFWQCPGCLGWDTFPPQPIEEL